MIKTSVFARGTLRGGSALQALALLGAGVGATMMFAVPAAAQDYTNLNATGRVQGTDRQAIEGATVTVTSNDQGFSRTVTTGSGGSFRIGQIPQGSYTFTVSAEGYDTFTDNTVVLTQDNAANQFTLAATGAAATSDIVVTAGRQQVADFDRTTTGAVINIGQLATRVPVARDLNSIVQLSPGTALGDTAFGGLSSVAGSAVSENVFYINGLNITEFREGLGSVTVPFDFYETVEVKNGGYPAEFGRSTGAFVNATTKSGSNDFHASVLFNWEPNELHEDSPNTYAADNDHDASERLESILQLSGPIIKDHLFFYGLYSTRKVTSRAGSRAAVRCTGLPTDPNIANCPGGRAAVGNLVGYNGVFDNYASTSSPFYGGKLDAVIVDGQRLEFTYFNTSGKTYTNTFAYDQANNSDLAFQGTNVNEYGGENFVGRYTGNFTDWLTLSGAYGEYHRRDNSTSSQPDYPYIDDQRSGSSTLIGNSVNAITTNEDIRKFYRFDADLYFNLLGSHHVRGGYDHEKLTSRAEITYTGGVAYTYLTSVSPTDEYNIPVGTQYATARHFVNGGSFPGVNEAYYLEDAWSLFGNRLTLNIGVRNDRFTNSNVAGEQYYNSGDNWAPRLSFTADPFGDGRTKVYGSFGRYFLPIAANTNIRLGGAELDYDQIYLLNGVNADGTPILGAPVNAPQACPTGVTGTNCNVRNYGVVSDTGTTVAKNLKNQAVDEYIVGFERRFGARFRVGVYGTYRKLTTALEDSAVDAAALRYCAAQGFSDDDCSDLYGGFSQYVLINPGSAQTIQLYALPDGSSPVVDFTAEELGYPKAKRTYKAVTATFDRDFDGKWELHGSYTLSYNKGNYEGGVKSDNGQTDSGLSTDFDQPALVNGAYGYLPNDRRHTFKLYGSYQMFDWLTVGGQLQAASPRSFGCLGRVPVDVDPFVGAAYGAEGHYCNLNADGSIRTNPALPAIPATGGSAAIPAEVLPARQLVERGSVFKSDWLTQIDLDVALKIPTDAFDGTLRLSVFNVFNQKAKLDYQEVGTTDGGGPRADYGMVSGYQPPRYVRLQFGVGF